MRHRFAALVFASTLAWAAQLPAETHAIPVPPQSSESARIEIPDTFPHPHISEDGGWAGALVIAILLGFFLPAAVIGPIVRSDTPEEVPPAHSHDEPPGASGHHGHSGTHAEDPHH
jgi:hypothetical protein